MKPRLASSQDKETEASGAVSVREAGARGGRTTLERRGTGYFKRIGRKGGLRTKQLYSEMFREFGRRGGRPRRPSLEECQGEGGR